MSFLWAWKRLRESPGLQIVQTTTNHEYWFVAHHELCLQLWRAGIFAGGRYTHETMMSQRVMGVRFPFCRFDLMHLQVALVPNNSYSDLLVPISICSGSSLQMLSSPRLASSRLRCAPGRLENAIMEYRQQLLLRNKDLSYGQRDWARV